MSFQPAAKFEPIMDKVFDQLTTRCALLLLCILVPPPMSPATRKRLASFPR